MVTHNGWVHDQSYYLHLAMQVKILWEARSTPTLVPLHCKKRALINVPTSFLLPGKTAGQDCRARLPGKTAGQDCRARLPGKTAGQDCRASLNKSQNKQMAPLTD
jgi:hypothetical protein